MADRLKRILVVNDDNDLASSLADNLRLERYEVRCVSRECGLATAVAWPADLIILDHVRRSLNGSDLLCALRERGCHVPVLVLSQGNGASNGRTGLGVDAAQHMTGTVDVSELLAPVREILGSASVPNGKGAIRFGSVVVDPAAHTVTRRGETCSLTPKAFALLIALARRHGDVASRTELLREVWGYGPHVLTRTVDSHVAELRRKLEDDPSTPRYIVTVWAVGYRFVGEAGR